MSERDLQKVDELRGKITRYQEILYNELIKEIVTKEEEIEILNNRI